jgi:hypothetical protein
MRAIVLIMFVFMFSICVYADDVHLDNILNNVIKIEYSTNSSDTESVEKLYNIMALNVIEYFDKSSQTDSPLKLKAYKNSDEYKEYLNELKNLKKEALRKEYYVDLPDHLEDYDIKNKRFTILFNNKLYDEGHYSIYFPPLVIIRRQEKTAEINEYGICTGNTLDCYREYLIIPIKSEEKALTIENEKENIKILLLFNINEDLKRSVYEDQHDHIVANNIKLIIANNKTGEIYYSHVYGIKTQKGANK